MGASPANFLFRFLLLSIILWLIFTFASRLLDWILSRVLGASVQFRVGGWKCLRDIVVKFKKGALESVSIGEISLSVRQSLVKIGVGIFSRDPKLQVLICDLEVVMRASNKSTYRKKTRKSRASGRVSGRGKWMVVANIARFLSVSVTELVVKTPKATVEVKELRLGISKDGGSQPALFVMLHLVPVSIYLGESRVISDQYSINGESLSSERTSAPFNCEDFSLLCEFGHDREAGVVVRNVDITSGEVSMILHEELLVKKKSSIDTSSQAGELVRETNALGNSKKPDKKPAILAISKYTTIFPEKIGFTLPKLDIKFMHRGQGLVIENNILGIQLKSRKSRTVEDLNESTRLDVQLEFCEIHLHREAGISVVEILKLDVVSSVFVSPQRPSPIRCEIDIKFGGTQCNFIVSRFIPWMQLRSSKSKKMVLREEGYSVEKQRSSEQNAILWTCTASAPEMTIVLFNLSDLPVYHVCSQSSHTFANNISNTGTAVHMELGELNMHVSDDYQECLKESLFSVETNTSSLLHIAKVSLDLGKKDMDSPEDGVKCKMVLSTDVTGVGVYLTFRRLESLVSIAFSFQAVFRSSSASGQKPAYNRGSKSSQSSGKGIQLVNFNLERCSLNFRGEVGLENTVVEDPKRVNYGSQGGRFVINVSADGTPRTADIMSTISDEFKRLKYCVSLYIFHLGFCMNKEKQSTQLDLERARCTYQEYLEESLPRTNVALLDMQNAKFVRQSGSLKEVAVCSLFSATDISVRWEPDVHLALSELGLQLKLLVHNHKLEVQNNKTSISSTGNPVEPSQIGKQPKKRESIFAIDVEMLHLSAEAGDGVESTVQVQSIFSENARIGVLLEGLMLDINEARIFKSSRMQISRVPNSSSNPSNGKTDTVTVWNWVIQALDVHVCMPYRLQLRAIDDSIEEMLRALKLITSAKTKMLFPTKKESTPKKPSSVKIGRVKFCIRKLTVDIEEEPIQGWLDEHYRLLKNEACELAVRLNFLDEFTWKAGQIPEVTERSDPSDKSKIQFDRDEINMQDPESMQKLQDEIYKQSFRSYYRACQKITPSSGSGACMEGFQAGFKFSTTRTSVFSITATQLELSMTRIDGGDAGMIEILQKLDPVCRAHNIPFSRLYGSNIILHTGSLVAQLRDYTCPLFSGTSGRCEGRLILAQQATCFQPQIRQNVFVGRWRKVCMFRSASGTTPPMKTYCDLPIHFQKAEVSFGVGFEPVFADVSYAFTVALRRANLSIRNPNPEVLPPKKEKSLPWWDEMRNYIHGNTTLYLSETKWNVLATTDPYEDSNKLQIFSGYMELQQSDGRVYVTAKNFKILVSSLETLLKNSSLKHSIGFSGAFLEAPTFTIEVTMEWDCESGNPLNHYLFALPIEGVPREKVYDPFRSTSLSFCWNLSLGPSLPSSNHKSESSVMDDHAVLNGSAYGPFATAKASADAPIVNLGPHDLAWIIKFWNLNFLPPHKLRTFSRWPRFGVPRVARSGNLSMDRVMTEFMFRIDATPTCIRYMALDDDDPAKGLTFKMAKLKLELYFSRGKQKYTFESKRDIIDLVYQGVDLQMPKAYIDKEDCMSFAKVVELTRKSAQSASMDTIPTDKSRKLSGSIEEHHDDGFLLSSDYFTIKRQAPKADPARLITWQEAGRRNLETTYVRSEFENGSESDEHTRSDPSDDDGYNAVIADNCQRIFVYGLKLLWTLENRDAVWSWLGGISKAFEPPKPSPSWQYAQRKLLDEKKALDGPQMPQDDENKSASVSPVGSSSSPQHVEFSKSQSSPSNSFKVENPLPGAIVKHSDDSEEDGTRHFMVNVIEPQFNLHSEEANGRFLLAAVSGRVLARSFHSVLHIGYDMIEQALGEGNVQIPESQPEMTWNRMEFSVMLEHVQAHVAPTDVDLGAGLQWLPKICRSSPKVKRTGALLERVFMPCDMYFRYTRHKGGTTDLKVKPLKELSFNSHTITATMTSQQFHVMLDVLTNLLFARLPKPRKSSLSYQAEDDDDDDVEEETDEVVPDGVEEVELARIDLEQKEQVQKLILDDIRKLSLYGDASGDVHPSKEDDLWMIIGGRTTLIQRLKKELLNAQKSRKAASTSLRMALQKAAQLRLMEKEKNKSPSCAMRISLQITKVVWSMLGDGKSFAEAEINNMIYDFDRDYKDVGVARFTTKYFVVRNCLPNAKSDTLLSAWNPPSEWGKKMMLQVDAKQGAPKDGNSPLELFQVEIYPLKIHLTETMYRMMWVYFFPEEEQASQRRLEVWKVSTTAGSRRVKKGSSSQEALVSNSHSTKDSEVVSKSSTSKLPVTSGASQSSVHVDSLQPAKLQNLKANNVCGSTPELRRTSSFDRTWEESVAESVANELVLQAHSPSVSSLKTGSVTYDELSDEPNKSTSQDYKNVKPGRSSQEEKKVGKAQDDKRSRPRRMREFHNIKISQVELLVTYEGSRFAVSDLRLLMDTFHRVEFTGTWRRLFSRVKKHIIWGVLKSVTGMQGKKFKSKAPIQKEATGASVPDIDLNCSDSEGGTAGKSIPYPLSLPKRPSDGAGDRFVTSIRGLFGSQRRKAKAFVLRTMRGEADNEFHGDWSENEAEFSPVARQFTINKAKRLIKRHTKKFHSRGQKGLSSQKRDTLPLSPREIMTFESDSSSGSPYEDFNE
ncbi:hypothetical protein ACH5RR_034724 [Cinchona calisaya]|uniref:FMP27/BLTP2/Hobbit GFWDK motif-containing RBG unit domain-containing protein n=1 Tax=Cinchona calisaya TaxID=153742 RepID=A0ABD2YBR0_9GENT